MCSTKERVCELEREEGVIRNVQELESVIKKVVQDHDAKHTEIRSSADGLIQTKRGETDPAMCEKAQFTVKPRLSAL